MVTEVPRRLAGKVAVITGAGRGIGAALAKAYAREGAVVVASDIAEQNVARTAGDIRAAGGEALALRADVADAKQVDGLISRAVAEYGRIDVMLNNAAIVRESVRHVLDADESWWDSVIDTNLKGHFLCSLAAARQMVRSGGGVIITMSSGGATRAHRGMVAYDASKGGIEALTRALALDLAPYGIRVVGLIPGLIVPGRDKVPPEALALTDATVPLGRAGVPEDLAGAAVFLASDEARYMTGSFVTVDGGVLSQQRSPQVETFPVSGFPRAARAEPDP